LFTIFFSPHNGRRSAGGAGQDESIPPPAGIPAGAVDQVGSGGHDHADAPEEHRIRTALYGLAGEPESGHAALPFCARQSDECADLLLVVGSAGRNGSIVFYLHLPTLKLTVIVRRTSILSLRSTTHVHKFRDTPRNAQRHWLQRRDRESNDGPNRCFVFPFHLCAVNINIVLEIEFKSYLNAVQIIFKMALLFGLIL